MSHALIPGPEGGLDGFVCVADEWVDGLRARGGDALVHETLMETFAAVGCGPVEAATLTPALKTSAGPRGSSSSPSRPAVKSHNGHETQLRDPETGRWRASMFRRAEPARLEGARFFK